MTTYFFVLTFKTSGGSYTHKGTTQVLQPSEIFKTAHSQAVRKFNLSSREEIVVEFFNFWAEPENNQSPD
jgi:hypothetical protein